MKRRVDQKSSLGIGSIAQQLQAVNTGCVSDEIHDRRFKGVEIRCPGGRYNVFLGHSYECLTLRYYGTNDSL